MNEPPGRARARVGLSGLTVAEHFRDQGQDVLFFVDKHLPLHPGRLGSVGIARPYSFGGGLSADARPPTWARLQETHHHPPPKAR